MNNQLNQQPILYDAIAKQQYNRLQKEAANARALRKLIVEKPEFEKREPFLKLRLKATAKVLGRIWITMLEWIHAAKPKVFKEA